MPYIIMIMIHHHNSYKMMIEIEVGMKIKSMDESRVCSELG